MTGEEELRIGLGVDAHALEDGVPLVLGGVRVESARGLAGHSDGDVITHALIDALLGAADMGDIGSLFPSDGSTPPGVSSLVLLEDVAGRLKGAGWQLVNADWARYTIAATTGPNNPAAAAASATPANTIAKSRFW